MSELYFMMTVADRVRLTDFISIYSENGISISLIALGYGTASSEIIDYLGLDDREKAVCLSIVTGSVWKKTKKDLLKKLYIGSPGTGVAFTVPMSSIGGRRELLFLTQGQQYEKGDESTLKDTQVEMLIAVSNQGYSEFVMDAARAAGAAGGTVLHARGTGMQSAEKFLGISLASEKDVIIIVTKTEQKNDIMRSVMDKAGLGSKAGTIIFSLPVTDTAGLRLDFDDEE